jgi:hypothetical protein
MAPRVRRVHMALDEASVPLAGGARNNFEMQ